MGQAGQIPEKLLRKVGDNVRQSIKKLILECPAKVGITGLWRRMRPGGIPVIALHGVLPDEEARLFNATGKFVSPGRLKALLESICRAYTPISLDRFLEVIPGGRPVSNSILITFDDGYANVFTHAFPVFDKMGIPFAVFVTTGMVDTTDVLWNDLLELAIFSTRETSLSTDLLDRDLSLESTSDRQHAILVLKHALKLKGLDEAREDVQRLCERIGTGPDTPALERVRFLASDQIREMARQGVGIGGHTVTHPILSKENPDRVRDEVTTCKRQLEAITGKTTTCFA
jgi:peptidoglycan/xylan/chitin deacetylase (PgdA/CDA1 family)